MRRTRHRRRFHTDRVVANRRARYKRESGQWLTFPLDDLRRFSYGALDDRDPWDCGNPRCGICHPREPRRPRENREWRKVLEAAY